MTLFAAGSKLAVMHVLIGMACNASCTHYGRVLTLGSRLFVATLARSFLVCPVQPISRAAIVIKVPDRPGTGVVTVFAAHSKLLFVFVLIFMTREAIFCSVFVTVCFVTFLARRGDVTPCQRKTGPRMVVLRDLPGLVTMALFTLGTELILVLVIFLVATETVQRGVAVTAQIFVTNVTFNFRIGMAIAQLELRAVMTEAALGTFPVALSMALFTLFTEVANMLVVFLVAANALFGSLFVHRIFVALLALGFGVFAQQRKRRRFVVKLGRLFPVALGVAISAFLAQ